MVEPSTNPPWRNGYWFNEKAPASFLFAEGKNVEWKAMIKLDYPDMDSLETNTSFKFGNFGQAR